MSRIADIANDLNVSRSLVSKVLSGRMGTSSVRTELANAIKERAHAIDYRPNASAISLHSKRQNVIGIFLRGYGHGRPGSGLVEYFMNGASNELAVRHQRMLLQLFREPDDFAVCEEMAHRSVLDGVIVAGRIDFDVLPALRRILSRRVPVVSMLNTPLASDIPNVGINQIEVGQIATRHLIEQGCRRIACFHVSEDSPRFVGYKAALRDAGVPFDPELICFTGNYESDEIPIFINKLISAGISFDGVAASADEQASTALRAVLAAGIRVPQDVKITGVDNSPFCNYCAVPLTSISGEDNKRSSLAVSLLLDKIEGRTVGHITISPILVARESTLAKPQ